MHTVMQQPSGHTFSDPFAAVAGQPKESDPNFGLTNTQDGAVPTFSGVTPSQVQTPPNTTQVQAPLNTAPVSPALAAASKPFDLTAVSSALPSSQNIGVSTSPAPPTDASAVPNSGIVMIESNNNNFNNLSPLGRMSSNEDQSYQQNQFQLNSNSLGNAPNSIPYTMNAPPAVAPQIPNLDQQQQFQPTMPYTSTMNTPPVSAPPVAPPPPPVEAPTQPLSGGANVTIADPWTSAAPSSPSGNPFDALAGTSNELAPANSSPAPAGFPGSTSAPVPAQNMVDPWAISPSGAFPPPQPAVNALIPSQSTSDPWAISPQAASVPLQPSANALVPAQNMSASWSTSPNGASSPPVQPTLQQNFDPVAPAFGQPQLQPQQIPECPVSPMSQGAEGDEFWASLMGGGGSPSAAPPAEGTAVPPPVVRSTPTYDNQDLPNGGQYFTARIAAPMLGVAFYRGSNLAQSLFRNATEGAVDALGNRPIVGHIFEGSAAESVGIKLGNVVLSVNGQPVTTPEEATAAVRNAPRPLNIECYDITECEHLPITLNEGMHCVKYDTKDKLAPKHRHEWKPKYVVVGGLIAKPYQLTMYRSKAEYDTAVKEVMAGKNKMSVKIKQFSLVGMKVAEWGGNKFWQVEYKGKISSYMIIQPHEGNPIKIAGRSDEHLKNIHDGICHALLLDRRLERQEELYQQEVRERHEYLHGGVSDRMEQNSFAGGPGPMWADPNAASTQNVF